jgi:hypothetical protein
VTAAIFGLLGVMVGGVLNGVVNWWLQRYQTRSSAKTIARLVYDDFLHFQSTLVRSLADQCWWEKEHLLEEQVQPEGWKLLLGALGDSSSQDVAAARGWMRYLIEVWKAEMSSGTQQSPRELGDQLQAVRDTFCRLDRGREQLYELSGRKFRSFKDGGVLATLKEGATLEDLHIAPDECKARRKQDYARVPAHVARLASLRTTR